SSVTTLSSKNPSRKKLPFLSTCRFSSTLCENIGQIGGSPSGIGGSYPMICPFFVTDAAAHDPVVRVLTLPAFPGMGHADGFQVDLIQELQFAIRRVVARMKSPA